MALNKFGFAKKSGPMPVPEEAIAVKKELEAPMATPRKTSPRAFAGGAASPAAVKAEPPASAKKINAFSMLLGLGGKKAAEKVKKMRKLKVRRGHTASWGRLRFAGMKKPLGPYAAFSAEHRVRIQGELRAKGKPTDFAAVSKAVGAAWAALADGEKDRYTTRYNELKKVYDGAREAYDKYVKDHTKAREQADAQRALFRKAAGSKKRRRAAGAAKAAAAPAAKARAVAKRAATKSAATKRRAGEDTPSPKGTPAVEETPKAPTQPYQADPTAAIASFEHRAFKKKPLAPRRLNFPASAQPVGELLD